MCTDRSGLSEVSTIFTKGTSDTGSSSIFIVGKSLRDHSHSACPISFVKNLDDLTCILVLSCSSFDSTINNIFWDRILPGFFDSFTKSWVIIRISSCSGSNSDKFCMHSKNLSSRSILGCLTSGYDWSTSHSQYSVSSNK